MPTALRTYRYDSLDRLITTQAGANTQQRFYQAEQLITEFNDQQPTSFMRYADQPLAQLGADARLLGTDVQGSVLHSMCDGATETLVYGAYGQRPVSDMLASRLGFNGELQDEVTGHYLLGNGYRVFNTVLMRFNSPDNLSPFGNGGLNTYVYCAGDPVNYRDPTGRLAFLNFLRATTQSAVSNRTEIIAGVKAIAPGVADEARNMANVVINSVTQGKHALSSEEGREFLKTILDEIPEREMSAFSKKLRAVNRNLASHNEGGLSLQQAEIYIGLAKDTNSGKIGITEAHNIASNHWKEVGGTHGRVGSLLNTAAAWFSRVERANFRRVGDIRHLTPTPGNTPTGTPLGTPASIRKGHL